MHCYEFSQHEMFSLDISKFLCAIFIRLIWLKIKPILLVCMVAREPWSLRAGLHIFFSSCKSWSVTFCQVWQSPEILCQFFFLLKLTGALIGFNTWKVSLKYLIHFLLKKRVSFSLLTQYLLCFRILLGSCS